MIRRLGGLFVALVFFLIFLAEVQRADDQLEYAEQQRLELARQ